MNEIITTLKPLILIEVMTCLIVLGAMVIDLISGLAKAKMRGDARRSEALKRSLIKFITYQGGLLIAAGIDTLMCICHFWSLIHMSILSDVPGITCIVGVFLLAVEGLSVKEKADEKTHAKMNQVGKIASEFIDKNELTKAIADAIINARKETDNG